jgi:hypothetical protein
MEDESTSYHEQAITTLKSENVVKNHVGERKWEQIEATQDLHQEKSKEVSTKTSSTSTSIPKIPYEPRAPIPSNLKSSLLGTYDTLPIIIAYV